MLKLLNCISYSLTAIVKGGHSLVLKFLNCISYCVTAIVIGGLYGAQPFPNTISFDLIEGVALLTVFCYDMIERHL